MKLQKHIPVKRSVEQLMLEIEKAEIISNVQISTIAMGSAGSDESIEAAQPGSNETQTGANSNNENESNTTETASTTVLDEEKEKQAVVLPSGMKKTPFTINGEAKNYFELEKFLESLQGLQRKITLDKLLFKGLNEVTDNEQQMEKITSIFISAFYFPKLEDLRNGFLQLIHRKYPIKKSV